MYGQQLYDHKNCGLKWRPDYSIVVKHDANGTASRHFKPKKDEFSMGIY